jgi:hypothetical protein
MQTVIPLDTDWRYFPTADRDEVFGGSELDDSSWGDLPQLADLPLDVLQFYGELNLKRHFDLEPIGELCLRFHLEISALPVGAAVYVNGWQVGQGDGQHRLQTDVTDYVSLENNVLLLKLKRKASPLGQVLIRPVPCGSL